jgi:hypothetical protein
VRLAADRTLLALGAIKRRPARRSGPVAIGARGTVGALRSAATLGRCAAGPGSGGTLGSFLTLGTIARRGPGGRTGPVAVGASRPVAPVRAVAALGPRAAGAGPGGTLGTFLALVAIAKGRSGLVAGGAVAPVRVSAPLGRGAACAGPGSALGPFLALVAIAK